MPQEDFWDNTLKHADAELFEISEEEGVGMCVCAHVRVYVVVVVCAERVCVCCWCASISNAGLAI